MEEPENNGSRAVGAGDTSGAIVESQSTQLLDFVLGRDPGSLPSTNTAQVQGDTSSSVDHHSKESADASFSSVYASAPSYHFHGLAATQSQPPLLGSEDSQKENDHAYAQVQAPASKAKYPLTPSHALSSSGNGPSLNHGSPQFTKTIDVLSSTQKASLQKGPTKESTKQSAMKYRRRPSPTFPSQDSFAGPTASQDPDLFIATSRQFDIPLDQLGRPNTQDQSVLETSTGRVSTTSSAPPVAKPAMDDYSLSSSSSGGKILVANSDSSGSSQGSQRNKYWSISQEPTQLNSDASDAATSEHADEGEAEAETSEQVANASTRVEPTQARTQEPTQIVDDSVISGVCEPEPVTVSNKLSHLSLIPPSNLTNDLHVGRSSGPGYSVQAPGSSSSGPSVVVDKRSLLSTIPPEKRARYMHHLQKNSVPAPEASRVATAGTSSAVNDGIMRSGEPKSPTSLLEQEIVQDSEQQIEMDISPVKRTKSRDQEVIPPSESDAADNSREEEEEEVEAGLKAMEVSPVKTPRSSAKMKQRSELLLGEGSSHKPGGSARGSNLANGAPGKSLVGLIPRSPVLASPAGISVPNKGKAITMGPPAVPQQHGRRKSPAKKEYLASTPPIASTSAATLHREQCPQSPVGSAAHAEEPEQDSPEIPLARVVGGKMEEEECEVENNDGMVHEDREDEKPPSRRTGQPARKRKRRNAAASTTKKAGKGKAAARKTAARAASVAPPPSKKARTSLTVAKKFGSGLGTQVFALFKSDSSYYGAEVHSLNGDRAHIKFFDGLEDPNLGVLQLRRFELRKGDVVIPGSKPYKAKVIDDSFWASENEVSVEYIEGPEEGLEFTVPADGLRVPSRIVQSQWKDRVLEESEIVPAVRKSLKYTPSPSKNSVINTAPPRGAKNKLLSKYGIIITQGPGNQNWSREKEKYVNIVKENGGTVLSDWLDVFSLHGKHLNGNKRWMIQRSDVRYSSKDKHSFDRVFLVSDVHNQKPKYLLALALGIPCVSVDWLDHILAGEEAPWSQFLLAAGHSEPLGAPVSQMVDLGWGSTAEHMTEIMENSVPLKVLSGTSVLCVGSDLFPQPAKKCVTDADRTLEASRTVPRIILSMGAERVEAVVDPKYASKDLAQYDYVVIKQTAMPHTGVHGVRFVDVNWIKECLIAGRLFPVPESLNN